MTNLSDYFLDKTFSGDAVAADINTGKIAWVDGAPLTGTASIKPLPEQNKIKLLIQNPTGISDANYTPGNFSGNQGAQIIRAAELVGATWPSWTLGTDGYCYGNGSWRAFVSCTGLSVPTIGRKYQFWGKTANATLTDGYGVRIQFNVQAGATDYWMLQLTWDNAASAFRFRMCEVIASVITPRGTVQWLPTSVNVPSYWHMTCFERDDYVYGSLHMWEQDALADHGAVSTEYYVASRGFKSYTQFNFSTWNNTTTEWLARGCMIEELMF